MVVNGLHIQEYTPRIQTTYIIAQIIKKVNAYAIKSAYGKMKKPQPLSRGFFIVILDKPYDVSDYHSEHHYRKDQR